MKKLLVIVSLLIVNSSWAQLSDFNTTDFTIADNVAKLNEGKSLNNLPLLAFELTHKLNTDVEKFRAIYMWVCENIRGDSRQDSEVSKHIQLYKDDSLGFRQWNRDYKKTALQKLVKYKKTMCTGYAYLIKELSYLAGIECKIINGYGRTISANIDALEFKNHSWNVVKLNNKWYLCDATWSSGYIDDYSVFIKEWNEGYFLTEPKLFAQSHYPQDKQWLLDSTLIQSKFVPSPLVYGEAYAYKIMPLHPQTMTVVVKKNSIVDFEFLSIANASIDNISLIQIIDSKERAFDIYDIKQTNGHVTFKNKFEHRGTFDVHLKINDDIIASYVIKVRS